MKKNVILLILLCAYCSLGFGQTKAELMETITSSKEGVESIMKISTLNFRLTTVNSKPFDETDNFNFKKKQRYFGEKTLDSLVQGFFEKLHVDRHLIPPYNFLVIDKDEYDLISLLGFDNFYFSDDIKKRGTHFEPKNIIFEDNTSVPAKTVIETKESVELQYGEKKVSGDYTYYEVDSLKINEGQKMLFEDLSTQKQYFLVNSPKPVKEIEFDITLPLQTKKTITLDTIDHTFKSDYGELKVISISGNEVVLLVPRAIDDNLVVNGIYKDGRPLVFKANNRRTFFSEEKKNSFKKLLPIYDKALALVEKDKIKTEKELVQYLEKELSDDFAVFTEADQTLFRLEYSGPVSKIEIQLLDTNYIAHHYQVKYNLAAKESTSHHIATDIKSWNLGIINNEGKWVVKPAYGRYFRKQNDYFYWDQYNNYSNTYLFNPKTETIQKVNYLVDDVDIIAGKYVKIEPKVNGLRGVVDATTGKIVIPMVHNRLNNYDEKYWIAENDNTKMQGVLSLKGDTILPYRFDIINYEDGFFYTKYNPSEKINTERVDVYNNQGVNITKGKYSRIEDVFSSGLLLAEVYKYDPNKSNVIISIDRCFIDTLGHVVLSFPGKGYHDAEPFNEGLAKIEKVNNDEYDYDGDFGYIDNKGNVVIPYMYDTTYGFHDGHAYVEYRKNGEHWYGFINKENKVVKKVKDGYQSSWYDKEDQKWYIKLWNDEVVDYQGNTVSRK